MIGAGGNDFFGEVFARGDGEGIELRLFTLGDRRAARPRIADGLNRLGVFRIEVADGGAVPGEERGGPRLFARLNRVLERGRVHRRRHGGLGRSGAGRGGEQYRERAKPSSAGHAVSLRRGSLSGYLVR